MRRQKKPTFAINIRFSHFAPLISLPRTLFARSQTLYKPSVAADSGPRTLFPRLQTLYKPSADADSGPRTLFPCSQTLFPRLQTLYTRYSGLNGSTMHCCK